MSYLIDDPSTVIYPVAKEYEFLVWRAVRMMAKMTRENAAVEAQESGKPATQPEHSPNRLEKR